MTTDPLRSALEAIVDRSPLATDGETADQWCIYCDLGDGRHMVTCEYEQARVALAAPTPPPLDMERLARALRRVPLWAQDWRWPSALAQEIRAAYAEDAGVEG